MHPANALSRAFIYVNEESSEETELSSTHLNQQPTSIREHKSRVQNCNVASCFATSPEVDTEWVAQPHQQCASTGLTILEGT